MTMDIHTVQCRPGTFSEDSIDHGDLESSVNCPESHNYSIGQTCEQSQVFCLLFPPT
jgi:hypothetical protein